MSAPLLYTVIAYPAWGHTRGEMVFALRLVAIHAHIKVNLYIAAVVQEKTDKELAVFRASMTQDQLSRFRVVYYPFTTPPPPPYITNPNLIEEDNGYIFNFSCWIGSEAIKCVEADLEETNGSETDAFIGAPAVIFWDILACMASLDCLQAVLDRLKFTPKLCRLSPVSLPFFIGNAYAPEQAFYQLFTQYDRLVNKEGVGKADAFQQVFAQADELVKIPGLGPMYLWELDPSRTSRWDMHCTAWINYVPHARQPAKDIVFWPAALTSPDIDSIPDYGDQLLCVGPQLWGNMAEIAPRQMSTDPAMVFLDKALESHGPNSVIYVAFGSEFCPPSADQLDMLFEEIGKSELLLLAGCCGGDSVVNNAKETIAKMGKKGLKVDWAPQADILSHPAVNCFVTHCGSNSTQEAMLRAVPMICWPGAWDQPWIANEISLTHKVGVELYQARSQHHLPRKNATGVLIEGTDDALRCEIAGILKDMQGERGSVLRENAKMIAERLKEDVTTGESWKGMLSMGSLV